MNQDESKSSIQWTEEFLGFSEPLTHDQRVEWLRVAMDYTKKDWEKGIRAFYRQMTSDFKKPLGKILQFMPPKEVKPRECPLGGFKEDPKLSTAENMKRYMEHKGYGNSTLLRGKNDNTV